jgi:hypothetical protein
MRVRLSPLFGLLYQRQLTDDDDCGAIGGMKIGRGNRSTRRKRVSVPLCPSQISRDLNRARTRAATLGSRGLTSWAMVRPVSEVTSRSSILQQEKNISGTHRKWNCMGLRTTAWNSTLVLQSEASAPTFCAIYAFTLLRYFKQRRLSICEPAV